MSARERRILVIGAAADHTLARALRRVRAEHPDAEVDLIVPPHAARWRRAERLHRIVVAERGFGLRTEDRRYLAHAGAELALLVTDGTSGRAGRARRLLAGLPAPRKEIWGPGGAQRFSRARFLLWELLLIASRVGSLLIHAVGGLMRVSGFLWLLRQAARRRPLPAVHLDSRTGLEETTVLLVSGQGGASARYRCQHKAEQLAGLGLACRQRTVDDYARRPLLMADDAAACGLAILHRVPHLGPVPALLDLLGRGRRIAVYDADDLVFVPQLADRTPGPESVAARERRAAAQAATLARCACAMVATEPLAAAVRETGKEALVLRNCLGEDLAELSQIARRLAPPDAPPAVGYFSGTPTHDRDFAVVARPLAEALSKHPQTQLLLVGPLAVPSELAALGSRLRHLPFQEWTEVPALLAQLAVNLAPLEPDNPFAAAKSEIKYVEAAAVGVPTIASPTPAYRGAIRRGDNGLLAGAAEEWREAIESVLSAPELRRRLAERAEHDALDRYHPRAGAQELMGALHTIIARYSGVET